MPPRFGSSSVEQSASENLTRTGPGCTAVALSDSPRRSGAAGPVSGSTIALAVYGTGHIRSLALRTLPGACRVSRQFCLSIPCKDACTGRSMSDAQHITIDDDDGRLLAEA